MTLAKTMTFTALAISAAALTASSLGAFELSGVETIALLIAMGVAAVASVALAAAD